MKKYLGKAKKHVQEIHTDYLEYLRKSREHELRLKQSIHTLFVHRII